MKSVMKFMMSSSVRLKMVGAGVVLVAAVGVVVFMVNKHVHKLQLATTEGVVAILREYALTYDIDARSVHSGRPINTDLNVTGFDIIKAKIASAVALEKPIQFSLVGFPYKSQNTAKKVVVARFDAADAYALTYINSLLEKIAKLHKPGAQLTLFIEGMLFCDVQGVSDLTVADYENALKAYVKKLPRIHVVALSDLLPQKTPNEMRAAVGKMAPSYTEFEAKRVHDRGLQKEVGLMEKRLQLEFDYPGARLPGSVHTMAKQLIHRSMQFSAFLKSFRPPEGIRLSAHYSSDVLVKLGIKFSPNSFITPWHGVLVRDQSGKLSIKHRMDIVGGEMVVFIQAMQ